MADYPELEKIKAVSGDSQKLGEFLEWLQKQGYVLARYVEHTHVEEDCYTYDKNGFKDWYCSMTEGEENLVPQFVNVEDLLARYFNVDNDKAEQERKAILEKLRQ